MMIMTNRPHPSRSRTVAVHIGNGNLPPPEPDDPVATRRRIVAKRPPTAQEEEFRQKRKKSEPVPELFPFTGRELSEDVFEMLIDLFASHGSEQRHDSRVQSIVRIPMHPKPVCTLRTEIEQGPRKRRVEVSLRTLTRKDRVAFTAAKQKEWALWLDNAVELVKDRLKVPRSHILRARWVLTWKNVGTEKVPKARLFAPGFQDELLATLPTSSPTLTSVGESATLQWIVNEGHLLDQWRFEYSFLERWS